MPPTIVSAVAPPARHFDARAQGAPDHRLGYRPPARHTGTVTRVAPNGRYGWVTQDHTGTEFFVPGAHLGHGAWLRCGARLTFLGARNERGWLATDVRPA